MSTKLGKAQEALNDARWLFGELQADCDVLAYIIAVMSQHVASDDPDYQDAIVEFDRARVRLDAAEIAVAAAQAAVAREEAQS